MLGALIGYLVGGLAVAFLIALVYVAFRDQINAVVGMLWDIVGDINVIGVLELAFTLASVALFFSAIVLVVTFVREGGRAAGVRVTDLRDWLARHRPARARRSTSR